MQQGQVAAARSAGSRYQLLHGRIADNKLAIVGGAGVSTSSSQQKGSPRRQGLKLPSSWQHFEEVPQGSYVFGQDGRVQQFEFAVEPSASAEVQRTVTRITITKSGTVVQQGKSRPCACVAYDVRCLKEDCLLQASKQIRPEDQLLISMMANTGIAACSNGFGEIAHSADGSVGVRTIRIHTLQP